MVSVQAQEKKFQFYYQNGKNFYYAAYESVKFYYDKSTSMAGYTITDKFGRLTIRLDPGWYICRVVYRKKEYTFRANVDYQARLRKVYFSDTRPAYIHWGKL